MFKVLVYNQATGRARKLAFNSSTEAFHWLQVNSDYELMEVLS